MVDEGYIMSIDIGTQSVRAIVFNADGEIIANERVISEPYYSLKPGWAEVKAESVWENVCSVTMGVVEQMGYGIHKIKGCGITANRGVCSWYSYSNWGRSRNLQRCRRRCKKNDRRKGDIYTKTM